MCLNQANKFGRNRRDRSAGCQKTEAFSQDALPDPRTLRREIWGTTEAERSDPPDPTGDPAER